MVLDAVANSLLCCHKCICEIDSPIDWPRAGLILQSSDWERDRFFDWVTESKIELLRARLILRSSYRERDRVTEVVPYGVPYVSTTQCKLPECKSGICASGWKEKHHQRKLQWVKPPRVQVESLCQRLREKHHHRKLLPVATTASTGCKGQGARCEGQDQHQCKSERDAAATCNSNHHHYRPTQEVLCPSHKLWPIVTDVLMSQYCMCMIFPFIILYLLIFIWLLRDFYQFDFDFIVYSFFSLLGATK